MRSVAGLVATGCARAQRCASSISAARASDSALETDLRHVIAQLESRFSTRVVIEGFAVTLDGGSFEGLMALVDALLVSEADY